jgi:hypothetical protein
MLHDEVQKLARTSQYVFWHKYTPALGRRRMWWLAVYCKLSHKLLEALENAK